MIHVGMLDEECASVLFLLLCLDWHRMSASQEDFSNHPIRNHIRRLWLLCIVCMLCCITAFCMLLEEGLMSVEPRMWWCFPRQVVFWDMIHSRFWSEARLQNQAKYRMHYRMSYEAFHELKEWITPHLPIHEVHEFRREPIQADLALASVLWRFAQGDSTRSMATLFGIGNSTITKYMYLIVKALCSREMFAKVNIVVPSGHRLSTIIADFKTITSLPNLCGAVDGTHIKLQQRKPSSELFPAQYACRHGFHSILLQGIVDSKKLF